jgi:hypothetical protein
MSVAGISPKFASFYTGFFMKMSHEKILQNLTKMKE